MLDSIVSGDATSAVHIDRDAPTRKPATPPVGFHRWTDLLFVHWRVPVETVSRLIPPALDVDTFDDCAWVAVVFFSASRVRPYWAPSIPRLSEFRGVNVRTYVHRRGHDPGIWFMSLNASRRLTVQVARWSWGLDYSRGSVDMAKSGDDLRYRAKLHSPNAGDVCCDIDVKVQDRLDIRDPACLERFLAERYLFYSQWRGPLRIGRVHHAPYPLHNVELIGLDETLLDTCGLQVGKTPDHVMYSPGVDVTIHGMWDAGPR